MKVTNMKCSFGNLLPYLLMLIVGGFLYGPAFGQSGAVAQGDFNGLKTELQRHGWRVEQSPEGDLLLWAPAAGGESERIPVRLKQAAVAEGEQIPATDIDLLQQKLSDTGWVVQRDASGSLRVYRAGGDSPVEASAAGETGGDGRMEELRALLSSSGWATAKGEKGDLLLYPKPEKSVETTALEKRIDVQLSDRDELKNALTSAGWRVVEKRNGSLLLYPDTDQTTSDSQSQGPVAGGRVSLPVDSWKEAHDIARWWLDQNAVGEGLMVGKVRKVNWIYLVSIVEESSPFRLNNQLAIRQQDGTVVSLY